jgi:predicted O-linked N-acetylglucosamine transferase (SPINDLY family)
MHYWAKERGLAPRGVATREGIRVGLVSAHIRDHAVWSAIIKGWCQHLDRQRFSLHLFYTGKVQDQETSLARSQATHFVHMTEGLGQLVDAILGQQLDVILFPEVGMDAMTVKLASLRLAPVQIASWGHPETTGLPTVDYYLSAEDFEPEGAEANYREQLFALPHLGCCYEPLRLTPPDLDLVALGVDTTSPLLVCPGSPFKYAPQHDWVFVEVARRLGRCQFIFFDYRLGNLNRSSRNLTCTSMTTASSFLGLRDRFSTPC